MKQLNLNTLLQKLKRKLFRNNGDDMSNPQEIARVSGSVMLEKLEELVNINTQILEQLKILNSKPNFPIMSPTYSFPDIPHVTCNTVAAPNLAAPRIDPKAMAQKIIAEKRAKYPGLEEPRWENNPQPLSAADLAGLGQ